MSETVFAENDIHITGDAATRTFSIGISGDTAKRLDSLGAFDGTDWMKEEQGESCGHPGCLHHASHPCEHCGRVAGIE